MLDVHPAHHAASTWKEFFIHIATIVLGLIIAVGIEQTVEYIHHRHQAHDLEESLMQESLANRATVTRDLQVIDGSLEEFKLNAADLDDTPMVNGRFAYRFSSKNFCCILAFSNTAWLTVRDGGSLAMLPPLTASDNWHTEYFADEVLTQIQAFYVAFADFRSLTRLHADRSIRSPEEKSQLLLAMNHLQGMLRHLRTNVTAFGACNEIAIRGEGFTPARMEAYEDKYPAPPAP
jgi:hypothetical protein